MIFDFPCRVISTLPDRRVHVLGPSARMVDVLKEGGGLYLIAHSPQHGTFRYGLKEHMASHPHIDVDLAKEIATTGMIPLWLAREWEVEKYVRDPGWGKGRPGRPDREAMALRWVDAKHHGGYEWRQAVMLIWEYSKCAGAIPTDAAAPEIVHEAELPWRYRQAWMRSHNGGPVRVDQVKARAIDEARMWTDYELTPIVSETCFQHAHGTDRLSRPQDGGAMGAR